MNTFGQNLNKIPTSHISPGSLKSEPVFDQQYLVISVPFDFSELFQRINIFRVSLFILKQVHDEAISNTMIVVF